MILYNNSTVPHYNKPRYIDISIQFDFISIHRYRLTAIRYAMYRYIVASLMYMCMFKNITQLLYYWGWYIITTLWDITHTLLSPEGTAWSFSSSSVRNSVVFSDRLRPSLIFHTRSFCSCTNTQWKTDGLYSSSFYLQSLFFFIVYFALLCSWGCGCFIRNTFTTGHTREYIPYVLQYTEQF